MRKTPHGGCATGKSMTRVSYTQNIMGASHVAGATFGLRHNDFA
jgi:hypothetical protein